MNDNSAKICSLGSRRLERAARGLCAQLDRPAETRHLLRTISEAAVLLNGLRRLRSPD